MRYIDKKVLEYHRLRDKRAEEKIPTLSEYLSATYKEMKKTHRNATLMNFPNMTYGQSKSLKCKII